MAKSKAQALRDEIADAKERRAQAVQSDARLSEVRAIEDELRALRARQRDEDPDAFRSADTKRELIALREQQVAELSALPDPTPDQRGTLAEFRAHLGELKGGR
jgi:hypothetical protein